MMATQNTNSTLPVNTFSLPECQRPAIDDKELANVYGRETANLR
jgi:hypothetical protein